MRDSQALISVAARCCDVGRLAGMRAQRTPAGGEKPGELPVPRMTDVAVVIDPEVAKLPEIFPPMGLPQIAETDNRAGAALFGHPARADAHVTSVQPAERKRMIGGPEGGLTHGNASARRTSDALIGG